MRFHCFTVRQHHFWRVDFYRTWFQTRKRLHYYLVRLLHLAHAHQIPRPHVSVGFSWYIEVVVLITGVRVGAPNVQIHATATQARTGKTPIDGIFGADVPDVLRALLKSPSAAQEFVELVD